MIKGKGNTLKFLATLLAIMAFTDYAYAGIDSLPLTFDTQLIQIFETTTRSAPPMDQNGEIQTVLSRILGKLRHHQMNLKNVVYRTDMGVIRVTWADDHNQDIIKVAYKTDKDPVLGNSLYADKNHIIDVKISYSTSAGPYDYLRLEYAGTHDISQNKKDPPVTVPYYFVQNNLSNEKCKFCHELAKNDGSPSGVFFKRYQESDKNQHEVNVASLFDASGFSLMPAESAAKLGLPHMAEGFDYRKVALIGPTNHPETTRFARTLIELPQLIEVMARDNGKSTCVAVDFGENSGKNGFGRNDYVCADNVAKRLYVRMTNSKLTIHDKPIEYNEPYFEKK